MMSIWVRWFILIGIVFGSFFAISCYNYPPSNPVDYDLWTTEATFLGMKVYEDENKTTHYIYAKYSLQLTYEWILPIPKGADPTEYPFSTAKLYNLQKGEKYKFIFEWQAGLQEWRIVDIK